MTELVAPEPLAPGVYPGIPIERYHSDSYAVSNSGLSDLMKTPFHFYSLHLDPNRPPPDKSEDTVARQDGHLAHCTILEPLMFHSRYIVGPEVRRGTKAWEAFEALHPDKEVIKSGQYETARAQALSVRRMPDVAELLGRGEPEVSVYWDERLIIDNDTGETINVRCRCRPDWVHPVNDDSVILADVKTCGDASPYEFAKQIKRMGYHRQDAFYRRGYEKATGKKVLAFVFIAVEMKWPYASSAVMVDESDVEDGHHENQRLLQLYVKCLSTNTWPSYTQTIVPVSIPVYKN